jgi:hypothetical protein
VKVPAGVLEGFSFADRLGEGRGKSGEIYPKNPSLAMYFEGVG